MKIRIRRGVSDPYLHELFKSVLLYEPEAVKRILARRVGGKLLRNWRFERAYQERVGFLPKYLPAVKSTDRTVFRCILPERAASADVIWILNQDEGGFSLSRRIITHEVKTGKYDLKEVIKKYKKKEFKIEDWSFKVGYPAAPLYIWSWRKYIPSLELKRDDDYSRCDYEYLPKQSFRLLPLEWLVPILEKRMEVFVDV